MTLPADYVVSLNLTNMVPELIPSILCQTQADVYARLELVQRLVEWVQIDVLDRTLYANHTWADPQIMQTWEIVCRIELDLMVSDPGRVIRAWQLLPAFGRALWHVEAPVDHHALIGEVKDLGKEVGLSIAPGTPLQRLAPYLSRLDRVLVLGVAPGWSGQPLQTETLETVRALAKHPSHPTIAFDGGITEENLPQLLEAGVEAICPNSLIFQHPPVDQRVADIRARLHIASQSTS